MKRWILAVGIVLSLMLVPALAAAQTSTNPDEGFIFRASGDVRPRSVSVRSDAATRSVSSACHAGTGESSWPGRRRVAAMSPLAPIVRREPQSGCQPPCSRFRGRARPGAPGTRPSRRQGPLPELRLRSHRRGHPLSRPRPPPSHALNALVIDIKGDRGSFPTRRPSSWVPVGGTGPATSRVTAWGAAGAVRRTCRPVRCSTAVMSPGSGEKRRAVMREHPCKTLGNLLQETRGGEAMQTELRPGGDGVPVAKAQGPSDEGSR